MTREFVTPDQMREICAQAARYPQRYIYIAREVNKLVEQITTYKAAHLPKSASLTIGDVEISGSITIPCSLIRSMEIDTNGIPTSIDLSPCVSAAYKDLPRTGEGKVSLEDLWEAYKSQMSGGITNT